MKLATSYFYQIRFFKPWMIPVSTALSDPFWYKPPVGRKWFYDKRGVVNGLKYHPLIVQDIDEVQGPCPCKGKLDPNTCPVAMTYEKALREKVDKKSALRAFQWIAKKMWNGKEEPIVVLMVHESLKNPCSERYPLQEFFGIEELSYPII